jgi:hypothetical protein
MHVPSAMVRCPPKPTLAVVADAGAARHANLSGEGRVFAYFGVSRIQPNLRECRGQW